MRVASGPRPRLYYNSARPFVAAGHKPGPDRGRLHIGGIAGPGLSRRGGRKRSSFGLRGSRSRSSLLLSGSLPVVRVARTRRSCRATPTITVSESGPMRPPSRCQWRAAGRHIRVASKWRVRRLGAQTAGAHCSAGRRGAGAGLRGRAGPGRPIQIKNSSCMRTHRAVGSRFRNF